MEAPSFVKKIAIVGPESTGKSSLAQALAEHYQTAWVPEYARGYLDQLVLPYQKNDLTKIAHGQLRLEDEWMNTANGLLFCDTNLIVIKIWSEFKYGNCDTEIIEKMLSRKYDLHLLTDIDLPWEPDPQREHPTKRLELFKWYEEELKNQKLPYSIIRGENQARITSAIKAINLHLQID